MTDPFSYSAAFNRPGRRGFSLVELAIVLGFFAAIVAGIWTYAGSVQQNTEVQQGVSDLSTLVEATRQSYGSQSGVTGGVAQVTPLLVKAGAVPADLLHSASTSCPNGAGSTGYFLESPFSINVNVDVCGTMRVCGWTYGGATPSTICSTAVAPAPATAQPYFAIEFISLNTQTCISLIGMVTPNTPAAGLQDIYVNGASVSPLPPTPTTTATACAANPGGVASPVTVDFIYALHPPNI